MNARILKSLVVSALLLTGSALNLSAACGGPQTTKKEFRTPGPISIWMPEVAEPIKLNPTFDQETKKLYSSVFQSTPVFDINFIRDIEKVHFYLTNQSGGKGITGTCTTEDGEIIHYTHFDRGSDRVVIVGAGFTNSQEYMVPFIGMFDCDVVLFDYRGHHYAPAIWNQPSTWKFHPGKLLFGIDTRKVKMGEVEDRDVIAVVETMKKKKHYKQICGLGVCYSSLIFIKAQSTYKVKTKTNLFDIIINDGTWLNLANQVDRIKKDLKLMVTPQRHSGCNEKWPLGNTCFTKSLLWMVKVFGSIDFAGLKVNILDYLPQIDIPIMYFHGKDDVFVPLSEFKIIWDNTPSKEKVAIITDNPHVRNHLFQKEVYKFLCDGFRTKSYKEFLTVLPIQK